MYPALAVLQAIGDDEVIWIDSSDERGLVVDQPQVSPLFESLLWVGGIGGMEAQLIKRAGIPYEAIPAAGVHGVGLRSLPGNLWKLGRGFIASLRLLRQFRPHVLFFTGGYVAVPMALAARFPIPGISNPRSLLYVPDIEPGLALRTLARFADQIAVTSEDSRIYFPHHHRVVVTGYPTRPTLRKWSLKESRDALGLSAGIPTLLVLGGSKGARSINKALQKALPNLLSDLQVVHISGQLDWSDVKDYQLRLKELLTPELANRYRAYAYLHEEMGAALTAADLVLSRAGASILGEYPVFGLPAILVPYPYGWHYQQVNAEYLAKRGGAVVIQDAELPDRLEPLVRELINQPQKLKKMSAAVRSLANPKAANNIANRLIDLASGQWR